MPYIDKKKREQFKDYLDVLGDKIETGGDMNYCFSMICKKFIEKYGENYLNHSECISALEGATLEWYRMRVAPYEDNKIVQNGDL